jgi:hypothetical protein
VLENKAKGEWVDTFIKKKDLYNSYKEQYLQDKGSLEGFDDYIHEEAIAEAFKHFDKNGAPPGAIGNIYYRLKQLFETLRNGFTGIGFDTTDKIFNRVEQGKMAPQEVGTTDTKYALKGSSPYYKDYENLASVFETHGLDVKETGSAHSNSRYVEIIDPISGESVTARFSNHPQSRHAMTLHGPADIEIGNNFKYKSWEDAVSPILERINKSRKQFGDELLTIDNTKYALKPNEKEFFNNSEKIPESEGVAIIRDGWIGGVSGIGDRDGVYDLHRVQGGNEYIKNVQDFIRKQLGNNFKGYRLMSNDEFEEFKEYIHYDFMKDNNFSELKEAELMTNRLSLLGAVDPYTGRYFSQKWIQQNVLRLTDDDIEEMQKQIEQEKKDGLGLPVSVTNDVAQQQMMSQVPGQPQNPTDQQHQADMQQAQLDQQKDAQKKEERTSDVFTKLKQIL